MRLAWPAGAIVPEAPYGCGVGGGIVTVRPLIKWAGGKHRLAPRIDAAFGERCAGTYVEPFLGSGAVFLFRKAHGGVGRAVLADANEGLIEFHRSVRDEPGEVVAHLGRLPSTDYREQYYVIRGEYNAGPRSGALHAARFLWLNRACFNGLYRENRAGDFNVPVGRFAQLSLPDPKEVYEVSRLLQGTHLVTQGFEATLADCGRGDQIYCDPPYVPLASTSSFDTLADRSFGLREQRLLAGAARSARDRGGRVVLSNHDLPLVRRHLYPESDGFTLLDSGEGLEGGDRGRIRELIATIGPVEPLRPLITGMDPVFVRKLEVSAEEIYAEIERRPKLLEELHWRSFEILIDSVFRNQGFRTILGSGMSDQGVDLRIIRDAGDWEFVTLVQAKRFNPSRPVGMEVVQALFGAVQDEEAHQGLVVTTSYYEPGTKKWADKHPRRIRLADSADVVNWCARARQAMTSRPKY